MCCRAVGRNTFRQFEVVCHSRCCNAAKYSVWVQSPTTAPQVTLGVSQWMMGSTVNLWCKQTTLTIEYNSGNSECERKNTIKFAPLSLLLSQMGIIVQNRPLFESLWGAFQSSVWAPVHVTRGTVEREKHRGRRREWKLEATAQDAFKETKALSVWGLFAIVVHHEPDSWVCSTMQVPSERCTSGSPVTSN